MTEQITALLVAAAVGIPQSNHSQFASLVLEVAGVLAAVAANAWLGKLIFGILSKDSDDANAISPTEAEPRDLTPAN